VTVALAYLRRDFLIWTSYRLAAFWQFSSVVLLAVIVFLAGNAIGERSELINEAGGDYVAFLLVGLAVMDLMAQAMTGLPAHISESQRQGTLEPILITPITSGMLLTSFWLFRFLIAMVRAGLLIGFGAVVLGYWQSANLLTVALVLIPAILTFVGIGALSGAFVIVVKQGDPIRVAYAAAMAVLGGVVFPVTILPDALQSLAALLPITHALSGIRAGLDGHPPADVLSQIAFLVAAAAIVVPLSGWLFDRAVARAKRQGSLGDY